jgi:hypothetical protein
MMQIDATLVRYLNKTVPASRPVKHAILLRILGVKVK